MSVFNRQLFEATPDGKHKISPLILSEWGPFVDIAISIPNDLAEIYQKQGKSLPAPKTGLALIDTGAKKSAVVEGIMRDLGVKPIGIAISDTTSENNAIRRLYPAHFTFPLAKWELEFTSVVGVNDKDHKMEFISKVDNKPIIALIGRDLLAN